MSCKSPHPIRAAGEIGAVILAACGARTPLPAPPPVCGNAIVQPPEECDLGSSNGVLQAFLVTQSGGTHIETEPIARGKSAVDFYDYTSASSHTGLEAAGEGRLFLYVDTLTQRLSLFINQGIDFNSSGVVQPTGKVDMDLTGLPSGWAIDLTDDDPSEFFKTGASATSGRWSFNENTDGAVIGGLPCSGAWSITLTADFIEGITTWVWVRDDLTKVPLTIGQVVTIQAFDQCGADCTTPRCGEVADGG